MNIHCAFLLAALALPGAAAASAWDLQPGSTLEFTGSMQGEGFEGRFGAFDADIVFDPADLAGARFDVAIDLASADTDNSERDETLLGPEFFDVADTPQAHYVATRFRSDGDGFLADGELTLHGVTRPVPLHFTFERTVDGAVLAGHAELDRLQFGIGSGEWADPETIAHAVQVETRLELRPATSK